MRSSDKKRVKAEAKHRKKTLKADAKSNEPSLATGTTRESSPAVQFSSYVRGGLSLLTGASIVIALVLGQSQAVISLDDIFANLITASFGKVVLALISAALIIHGLKKLALVR